MKPEFKAYLSLVRRLDSDGIGRSENDLSARLSRALEAVGLHAVVDTGGGADRRRRPDILCYVDAGAADLVVAADVVVESKKPVEVQAYPDLRSALVSDGLWRDKFVPYMRAHAEGISVFALTSFDRFLGIAVSDAMRAAAAADGAEDDAALKAAVTAAAVEFELTAREGGEAWSEWCETRLAPAALRPPPLSAIRNLRRLSDDEDLERFATALADVVVGREGRKQVGAALVSAIGLPARQLDDLPQEVQPALMTYTMAQHGGMGTEEARAYLAEHLAPELAEFVAASVHSLVGRLFAYKTIEDCFCAGPEAPLVPEDRRVFRAERYDGRPAETLPRAVFDAMAGLTGVANPAVRDLAATGGFYDWIAGRVDPVAFRRLIIAFFVHDFSELRGDLLGRFFEMYAQRLDRRRRRELGQYYTPQPVVAFMWRRALDLAQRRGSLAEVVALDPGVGSGTFLVEGARRLEAAGVPRFWERLVGFDVDPQVMGVAYVNLYLTVLGLLDRDQADRVGELHLYPTDALDPSNGGRLTAILPLLAGTGLREFLRRRIALSERLKRASRFEIVIGNPPYRNNSERTLAQVAERFPRLLATSRASAALRVRTIRDDYAWFFAAADYYITQRGIIAFVVSDSFCSASSYRHFREDLLRHYRVGGLVHLGRSVFRDVGPRTSFVIAILERRAEPLADPSTTEPLEYVDLRVLTAGVEDDVLGTPADPRLVRLAAAASEESADLLTGVDHSPEAARGFALLPAGAIVARVQRSGPPMHSRDGDRIFLKKWPGLITAFDQLFKAGAPDPLADRMRAFFEASAEPQGRRRDERLRRLATEIGLRDDEDIERLAGLAAQAQARRLAFEMERIKRTVSGSAPNPACWYPDAAQRCWVYYEPRLLVPRNVHEGRNPGFGSMSQWRDPASQGLSPKLIYTTARQPERGLKAFVIHDDWHVKIHGGTRQQFHYTGLENPAAPRRLDGLPNNLGEGAMGLFQMLQIRGRRRDDLLFFVAGLYNSQIAEDYLEQGGDDQLRVPVDPARAPIEAVEAVADASRALRDLFWLNTALEQGAPLDAQFVEETVGLESVERLGLHRREQGGGRFRQRTVYDIGPDAPGRVMSAVSDRDSELNAAVALLYGG